MNKLLIAALPVLLAGTAAAQTAVRVLPGALPYPTLPATLPSPVATYPVPMRIELPAPRLTPGQTLVLAAAPVVTELGVFPALPLPMIPSRPRVPVVRAVAEKENVRHPLTGIAPLRARLEETAAEKKTEKNREQINPLDEVFDGRRAPVRPAEVITFPEFELEREIGVGGF